MWKYMCEFSMGCMKDKEGNKMVNLMTKRYEGMHNFDFEKCIVGMKFFFFFKQKTAYEIGQ